MNLAGASTFSSTEWNSLQTRKLVLALLILVLVSLLFYNFMLAPELKLKQQLATKILQTNTSLKKLKVQGQNLNKKTAFIRCRTGKAL